MMMMQEILCHHSLSNNKGDTFDRCLINVICFLDKDLSEIGWMIFSINSRSASERRISNAMKRENENQGLLAGFLIGKKENDRCCIDVSSLLFLDGWIISVLTLRWKTHVSLLSNAH
jgi:hypothetical protein